MLCNEIHEHISRMAGDAVGVAGAVAVNRFSDQFPDDIDLRALTQWREDVRNRIHPAIGGGCLVRDIVLDDQTSADHLDIDRHAASVIGEGRSRSNVVGRAAALVLSLRQIEEPVGDIDLIESNVDIVGISGLGKDLVGQNFHRGFLQSVCLRRLTAIRISRGRRRLNRRGLNEQNSCSARQESSHLLARTSIIHGALDAILGFIRHALRYDG
ncbi:hypothetical protein D3C80_1416780 [compost metagenome]